MEKERVRKIVPQIHRLLHDPDGSVRVQAAGTLWKFTGDTKETLPVLIDTLKAKDDWAFYTALAVLAEMRTDAKKALPALRERLDKMDPDESLSHHLLDVMRKIDPTFSPAKK